MEYDDVEDVREYGRLLCGVWFFWRKTPLDESDRNRYRTADPMNRTKEDTTCLVCLASSS